MKHDVGGYFVSAGMQYSQSTSRSSAMCQAAPEAERGQSWTGRDVESVKWGGEAVGRGRSAAMAYIGSYSFQHL